jgi:choline kinase
VSAPTRAIILAAGAGTRLAGSDVPRPKCLAPFDGTPLIDLQFRALRWCGIEDVTVVVGFEADRVRYACGPRARFVENVQYAQTNSLYSLWLARAVLDDAVVIMNCDVLFHPTLLHDLVTSRYENAALVAYPDEQAAPFGDEEMKVRVTRGRVVDMSKDVEPARIDAENVGIVRFGRDGAAQLGTIVDALVASGHLRDWAPRAFAAFAREQPLYAIGTRGLPWTEIDTAEDYADAARRVYPAIREAVAEIAPALRRGA